MSTVIKVENISKQYRLGEVGTGAIKDDFKRWRYRMMGREDPFLMVGAENDRTKATTDNYVWALRDINFEVKQGEVLGIIGRNGAGKSTLLKILSRTTTPTTGEIKIKGRIASLLEVGTGFHPELSGRDNIFLNGAILGMTKAEIRSKFDEIVDFAGVEKYIDTPVKRYSSGMYVRLAFGVAAHLEPEILIVDEVLAVGDAEFQKKALGKMKDVSARSGRTVLFVSHNMAAIKNICDTGLLMQAGKIVSQGNIDAVLDSYFLSHNEAKEETNFRNVDFSTSNCGFVQWHLNEGLTDSSMYSREICKLSFSFRTLISIDSLELGLVLRDNKGEIIYSCNSRDNGGHYFNLSPGIYEFHFQFRLPAKMGQYEIDIAIVSKGEILDQWICAKYLTILSRFESYLDQKWQGIINEISHFSYNEKLVNQ